MDGRYKIVKTLGTGGFGHTYIAEDLRIPGNPKCVVKHLKPISNDPNVLTTARRLFHSEAESLAQLGNHDQIPRILAFFEQEQEFFLVQEFIEGHSLADELTPGKQLSESYAIALLEGLLPVLEFIHRQDVIHRDIKPANIIRRKQDSKLVLIDFGAVKQVRAVTSALPNEISNVTVAVGTPGYMPTEQRLGRPRANSDIYALGAIAIQSLVGMYPNNLPEDAQTGEMLWQHRATVSSGLANLLSKMISEHFQDRFQSAAEVWEALSRMKGLAAIPTVTVLPNPPICPPTEAVPQAEENAVGAMPGCELTLEWIEGGQRRTQVIRDRQPSKYPGTFRIGRDPAQCDLVLSDPSVSGLHAEIFYNPQQHCFYVRSLRDSNPPILNGMALPSGEAILDRGSTLRLGQLDLRAIDVAIRSSAGGYTPTPYSPPAPPQNEPPQSLAPTVQPPPTPAPEPIAAPVPPPTPPAPEPIAAPVPPPTPPLPEPPRTSSPNKLAWIAGAIAIGLLAGGAPFAINSLNSSKQCEAVIIANDNIRTEPTADNDNNIIPEFSAQNLEQKFPVTGTKTIEENGKFWVQLNLPGQRLAYAHNTVIANYSEIESCLKKSGKSFALVNAASLITSRPSTTASQAPTRKPPQSSKPAKSSSVPDNKEDSDAKKTASYQQGLKAGQTRGRELGKIDGEANGGQGAMHLEASCGDGAISEVSTNPDYLKGYKQGCEQGYREAFQSAREALNKENTTDNSDGENPPVCGDGKPAEFIEGKGYSCSGEENNPETPNDNPPNSEQSPSPDNSPSPASS
nr:FHA domain-containing serine/threonine-protein kinase [Oscillatoria sp. FACHB-1406]